MVLSVCPGFPLWPHPGSQCLITGCEMLFNATNLITAAAAKSTKRLCTRRKKTTMKNKNPKKCEAAFLKRRRASVNSAASASSTLESPPWMKNLAAQLWTKEHQEEKQFNRDKHRKKELLALKNGTYAPASARQKRKLESELVSFQDHQKKLRTDYERRIRKRCYAALIGTLPVLSSNCPSVTEPRTDGGRVWLA